jgi:2-polyprenyl-6-hydroxyphenyl methylase / 3-demethylubiquinone-9 3-methyltransferase
MKNKILLFIRKKLRNNLRKKLQEILREKSTKDSEILDIGCGSTGSLDYNKVCFSKLTGTDILKENVLLFKKNYPSPKVNSWVQNANNPLNGDYEIIVSAGVVQYLEDPKEFILNIKKILKKEGILVIATINKNSLFRRLKILKNYPKGIEKNLFNSKEIIWLLEKTGLKIVKKYGSGFFNFFPAEINTDIILVAKNV